jgi:hypothetical protein
MKDNGSGCGLINGSILVFAWGDRGKPQKKTSVRIAGVVIEI